MKKTILTIGLVALAAWITSAQQTFSPVTNSVVSIPPVRWSGTNAQLVAGQLLAVTNAAGDRVFPTFTKSETLIFRVQVGTNGVVQFITGRVQ